jgi:hypothetical protein
MDENKLNELFRDAVADVPPPSFDQRDIVAASQRQRLRRRNAIMGGSALGVAVLTGATVLGVALWRGPDGNQEAATAAVPNSGMSARNGDAAPNELPKEDGSKSPRVGDDELDKSFSVESPKQGGTPTGNAGPQGPGSTSRGCEQADREFAAALAGELPAAPSVELAIPPDFGCPAGSFGAAFQLTEGGRSGIVSAVIVPGGIEFAGPPAGQPEGTEVRYAVTPDGRQIVVVSEPEPGSVDPPYLTVLQGVADGLADWAAGRY